MTKSLLILIGTFFAAAPLTYASPVDPAPVEQSSPALQLARRVASMENDKDLPSRAVWLGKQVAYSARLAYQTKPASKRHKKKPAANPEN